MSTRPWQESLEDFSQAQFDIVESRTRRLHLEDDDCEWTTAGYGELDLLGHCPLLGLHVRVRLTD